MKAIIRLETNYPSGAGSDGPAQSSYHPLSPSPPMTITADLRNSSHWLPCHYFDYIAGTSTGGLISIMLGRLRMSIDECISEYETLGAKVFGHSRLLHLRSPLFWPRDKYNHLNLEKVVKELVLEKVPKVPTFPGGQNFAFDENRCRTVVISYQQQKDGDTGSCGVERPYLFRTYKNLHRGGDAQVRATDRNLQDAGHDIPIWEVARATSAAPTYFKPIQIQGRKYVDGGFGANNPCAEIYEEVRKMNNHAEKCVSIIVSVGTGKEKGRQRIGKHSGLSQYINYLNFAKKWASESEATHERMLGQIPIATETPFRYFRLNVEDGLGPIKLDEWKARGSIRTTIGACLGRARSSFDKSLFPREEKSNSSRSQNVHAIKDKRSLECIELVEHRSPNQVTTQASLQNGHVIEGQEPHGHSAEGKKPLDGTEFTKDQQNGHTVEDKKPFNYNKVTKDQSLGQDVIQASHLNGHIISVKKSLDFTEIATDQPTNQDLMQASHIPEIFQPKNKTLLSMRKHTDAYLKGEEVKKWIGEMAHLLVEGRRLRAKSDPQRWEKACFGAWFQCKIHGCPRGEKEYALRGSLQKHLLDKHRDKFAVHDPEKLNKALDDCKIVVY
ncbi:hypothetical protein MMC28_007004 [Mycoblastus sanguinarius]|nr:hypothetical protein [Mycoblastus sanguinarius]